MSKLGLAGVLKICAGAFRNCGMARFAVSDVMGLVLLTDSVFVFALDPPCRLPIRPQLDLRDWALPFANGQEIGGFTGACHFTKREWAGI